MSAIKNESLIILILGIVMLMESVDAGVLNTALPQIAYSLHVNPITLKVAITTYLLALGAFIPVANWLGDKLGIAKTLMWAVIGFTFASILCGFAENLLMLTASRALQGVFGAFMMPLARLTIVRVFKGRIAQTLTKTAPIVLIGGLLGPIVGGTITSILNWRFIFFLNIPIALLVLFLMWRVFPKLAPRVVEKFDLWGFLLLAFGLALTLFAVDTLIDPNIAVGFKVSAFCVSAILFVSYFLHSKRLPHPIVQLTLFKQHIFRYFLNMSIVIRLFISGMPFIVPLYVQTVLKYSAFQAGLSIVPLLIMAMSAKVSLRFLLKTFHYKKLLFGLYTLVMLTQVVLAFNMLHFNLVVFIIFLGILGWCIGTIMPLVNTAIYNSLDEQSTSSGLTINSAVIQLSASFGVALIAMILTISSGNYHLDWSTVLPKYAFATVLFVNASVLACLIATLKFAPNIEVRS